MYLEKTWVIEKSPWELSMKINLYQIIIVTISSVMLFQGIKEFVKRESGQTFLKFMVRVVVWGGMAIIAVYPNSMAFVSRILGFKENMNAVVTIGFLLIFIIIFRLLRAIERIEQNIAILSRQQEIVPEKDSE